MRSDSRLQALSRRALNFGLAVLVTASLQALALAQRYHVSEQFSATDNPAGPWIYGSIHPSGPGAWTDLTAFSVRSTHAAGFQIWSRLAPADAMPQIVRNPLATPVTLGTFTAAPYELWGAPGPAEEFAAVGWTCPGTGDATVEARFRGIDTSGGIKAVAVIRNGVTLEERRLASSTEEFLFNATLEMNAGDRLVFAVGAAEDSAWGDSTRLAVEIRLNQSGPPVITRQPADGSALRGFGFNFSVEAGGDAPLSYQWTHDGTNLVDDARTSGATTANLRVARSVEADAGTYAVAIANTQGSVSSREALLRVLPIEESRFSLLSQFSSLNNPSGAWSYGYVKPTESTWSSLVLLPDPTTRPEGFKMWNSAASLGGIPAVVCNPSTNTFVVGTFQVSGPSVWLHPGIGGEYGAVRWTAPFDGVVDVNVGFRGLDSAGAAKEAVLLQGDAAHLRTLVPGTNQVVSLRTNLAVRAGDTVVAAVGPGTDSPIGDSTRVDLTIDYILPPTITTHPAPVIARQGETVSLSVGTEVPGPYDYTWLKDGVPIGDSERISGARTSHLTIVDARVQDSGAYRVVVGYPGADILSEIATVVVLDSPRVLSAPPASQLVPIGSELSLHLTASGEQPLTCQWRFNGEPLTGETNFTLVLKLVTPAHSGLFSALLSNSLGTTPAGPFEVSVREAIWTSLEEAFSLTANPNGSWAWGFRRPASQGFGPFTLFTGTRIMAQGWEQWYAADLPDGFPCITRNATTNEAVAGTARVRPGQVWAFPGFAGVRAAAQWTAPSTGVIQVDASFDVVDSDSQGVQLVVLHGDRELTALVVPGGLAGAVTLATNLAMLQGEAVCFVAGDDGGSSAWADNLGMDVRITYLFPPQIDQQPNAVITAEGAQAEFNVVAVGTTPLTYRWWKDRQPLEDSAGVSGSASPTLRLVGIEAAQAGNYSVLVSNAAGSVRSEEVPLQIRLKPHVLGTPPAFIVAAPRESVSLMLEIGGESPITCQWLFNGAEIAGATHLNLTLTNVTPAQSGTYIARLANALGTAFSPPSVLNVDDGVGGAVTFSNTSASPVFDTDGAHGLSGPAFLAQLYAGPTGSELTPVGAAVPFLAAGTPGLFFGGTRHIGSVPAGQTALIQVRVWESGLGTSYEEAAVHQSRIGHSTVLQVITGGAGDPPSPPAPLLGLVSFALTDIPIPQVVTGPSTTMALLGENVALQVVATGQAPLAYQWRFGGNPVPGADGPLLNLPAVTAADAGEYSVVVTNALGSATSTVASLDVRAGLTVNAGEWGQVSVNPPGPTFVIGTPVELRAEATPGYLFTGWSGALTGDANPTALSMDTNHVVGATFARAWSLTLTSQTGGSVSLVPQRPLYADGSTVLVTANPEPGFVFTGWSGDFAASENPFTLTVTSNLSARAGFRDAAPPVVTILTPTAGSTADERVTLTGRIEDNLSVASARWESNRGGGGALEFAEGRFEVSGLRLLGGENRFRVVGRDASGNEGTAEVLVVWTPSRVLSLGPGGAWREGHRMDFLVELSSPGDVGGMGFVVRYDAAVLADPEWTWGTALAQAVKTVNTGTAGEIRATFSLPATALPEGRQTLATLSFRARSVPVATVTAVRPELQDVADSFGNRMIWGTRVEGLVAEVTPRRIKGDNNGNDRLDIGDATVIQRLATGLEEVRPWDVSGNDLNLSEDLDSGDVIRVLRVVVGLDTPPAPPPGQGAKARLRPKEPGVWKEEPAPRLADVLKIAPEGLRADAGQRVTVQVILQDPGFAISGATFALNYPVHALRLVDASSHRPGSMVPSGAAVMWNVAPAQDNFAIQSGRVSFAAAAATPWATSGGVLAEFIFEVQPGAALAHRWPLEAVRAELTVNGLDNFLLTDASLRFIARDPVPARLGAVTLTVEGFAMSLAGEPGLPYRIDTTTDLRTWTTLTTVTCGPDGSVSIGPAPPAAIQRFYRAVLE